MKNQNSMTINDQMRNQIYLAGLLHDIGKFYQRASDSRDSEESNLSKQTKKIEDYICPFNKDKNLFSHLHVLWTNEFLENNKIISALKENDKELFKVNIWEADHDNLNENNLINLAANHHKPYSEFQKIIQMADWWSAGMDRVFSGEDDKEEFNHHRLKFSNFKNVPLFSIFNILKDVRQKECTEKNKTSVNPNVAYSLKPLNITENVIIPKRIKQDEIKSLKSTYESNWKKFEEEYNKLPNDSFNGFEESLFHLLKKYTWSIPSNTTDMANVSLFEHLKTTAAIADSLYACYYDNEYKNAFDFTGDYGKLNEGFYPVTMLGIDLSGIQGFIYDISSKKAAQSLKGRSFYLQLLTEAIIQRFKNDDLINAKSANVLYATGGKAYLLLPNTGPIKERISSIKQEIEKLLWAEQKGKIAVNFASVSFAYQHKIINNEWKTWVSIENDSHEANIARVWELLAKKLNNEKSRKFSTLLIKEYDNFFNESTKELHVGGDTDDNDYSICAVTGTEIREKAVPLEKTETDGKLYISALVNNQIELGRTLKDADYIISFRGNKEDDNYLSTRAKSKITVLDQNFYLFDKLELINDEAEYRKITSADVSFVKRINTLGFLDAKIEGNKVGYGFDFYGGNQQAYNRNDKCEIITKEINKNNIKHILKSEKTFDQIAKTDKGKNTLLGVLRMDIDNLGKLFIKGIDPDKLSLSAYSTLSFHLELFFSGYLNEIRNKDEFKDWLNILYSGGDDLFVVGRWDKCISFAEQVRSKFRDYTQRPDIGISGGIAFVHEKFPISKAAEMAGDAESASKQHCCKNAITFFGETISWESEFETVKDLKKELVKYIQRDKKPLSKSLLHKLILYNEIKDKHLDSKNKNPDYSFLWHTAYYLKRFVEKYDRMKPEENEIYEFVISDLHEKLFTSSQNNFRYYKLAALAARWAEMELKDIEKDR